jgi:TolB-like protein/lipoprotein NlpI
MLLIGLNVSSLRARLLNSVGARASASRSKIHSLAVLPIENVSGDRTQDFLCVGLTDELTTDLAEVGSLRVVSRTSAMALASRHEPLPQVARQFKLDAVVEGTAMRDGGRVRITAQLIDARHDRNLWAGSFEGQATDILRLEDDVGRQIASYITENISSPKAPVLLPHPARSTNPAAQDAYWRGRYLIDRRKVQGVESAVADFRKAIAIDPQYAEAYAGLAQALLSESYLQAKRSGDVIGEARDAVRHALELDPNLSEAYCALGMIQGTYDYNWPAAEESLRHSLALNPSNSLAEIILSGVLTAQGRMQEAVEHARRALRLDPLSFFANRNLASTLYFARRYDEALPQFQRAPCTTPPA